MALTIGDKSVVSNLRRQFGNAVLQFNDEELAHAWRQYSISEDYDTRHNKPELFIDWAKMAQDGSL